MIIDKSPTLLNYKNTLKQCISLYYPQLSEKDLDEVANYSINKRLVNQDVKVKNSYTNKEYNMTLLALSDWINKQEPIVTSLGTMFKKHADCPNPMQMVIQSFLDNRKKHKKQMFSYPKGSAEFAKYNLLQSLT